MGGRWAAAPALGAVIALGAAACSSGGRSPGPSTAPAPPSTVLTSGPPPTVSRAVGARADLDALRCTRDAAGSWSARGTLRNATGATHDYAVSVFVVRTATGTVLGQAARVVRVKDGGTHRVSFPHFYTATAKVGLSCVPNVRRDST